MEIKDLLTQRRKELKLTMADVAEACGVSESTVSRWESGHIQEMKRSKIKALADILKFEPGLLTEDDPDYPSDELKRIGTSNLSFLRKIPVLGSTACGSPIPAIREYRYVEVDNAIKADFALVAEGKSMTGCGIMDGSLVFFKNTDLVENGEIAAITVGDSTTIKKFYKYGDTVVLRPCNPDFTEQTYEGEKLNLIHVFGTVVACLTSFQ